MRCGCLRLSKVEKGSGSECEVEESSSLFLVNRFSIVPETTSITLATTPPPSGPPITRRSDEGPLGGSVCVSRRRWCGVRSICTDVGA